MKITFEDDLEAFEAINHLNLEYPGGVFQIPKQMVIKRRQMSALVYLCDEWDFGMEFIGE